MNSALQVYDLGRDGSSLSRVGQMGLREVERLALSALRTADRGLVEGLVCVAVLPRSESSTLHLMAITTAGRVPHCWCMMSVCFSIHCCVCVLCIRVCLCVCVYVYVLAWGN